MTFMELAESGLLYILVIVGILFVMAFATVFLIKSWARAKELGYTKTQLNNVVKASVTTSIVPSIAIVIGFFGLTTMLGIPWPWWRLSVVGSVTYEIMAADSALNAVGVDIASASATDFTLVMFVMTICIMGGLISSIFISKPIQSGTMKLKNKDQRWGALGSSTFMLTIMCVFTIPMLLAGGVTLLTWVTSLVLGLLLATLAKTFKLGWLSNFIQAICLLGAMASSVLWTNLLG